MRLLLNVLWIIFGGGLLLAIEYLIAGVLLCMTVVGIPFGLQAFKLAGLSLTPFGKDIDVEIGSAGSGALGTLANILWFLIAGIWIFLSHIGLALGLAVTIIGIPFALQHLKLAVLALWPFGRKAA